MSDSDNWRERVNFVLKDPAQLDAIIQLLDPDQRRNIGRADVIRNALNLYAVILQHAEQGSRVFVGNASYNLKVQIDIPGLLPASERGDVSVRQR